ELRVRLDLDATGERLTLTVADGAGRPVLRTEALRIREASAEQVRAGSLVDHLYRVEFQPVRVVESAPDGEVWVAGGSGELARALDAEAFDCVDALLVRLEEPDTQEPSRIVVDATTQDTDGIGDPLDATAGALRDVQRLLSEPRLEQTELVWVTSSAVDAGGGVRDLARAPLWGLLRAARGEHAERVIHLIDTDDPAEAAAVPFAANEPELAVRDGEILAARLTSAKTPDPAVGRPVFDPDGTVLVTGGTGELGRAVARHLVREHGVRHLVLTSRRGPQAPGARDLVAELTAAGADSVRVEACDVADRTQVEALLRDDAGHPWTGVFHLAAVLDDGLLAAQSAERLAGVWAPKADGARHLDELSRELELDLAAFVLFSSAAGVLGGGGQSTYAAANTYLDALAAHRRALGLPGTSLCWGLWEQAGIGLTAGLGQAELARMRRQGVAALSERQALAALDAALARSDAQLVPVRLDLTAIQRRSEEIPPLLRGLVRAPRGRVGQASADASTLRDRLAALPAAERQAALVQLVRNEAAVVLGVSGTGGVGAQQVLKELGMDSLMAVELRRRLAAETGLTLPSTLAFDHPTPTAVAALLLDRLALGEGSTKRKRTAGKRTSARLDEPIAVVSMACRLPGGIDTPEGFWDLLASGGDAVGGLPQRWADLDVYDPDPEAPGKSYAREGGFIHDVEGFDAGFFGISQREALSMDPQQRLVLETSWEALERAGISPGTLSGTRTGVYLGTMSSDYGEQGRLDAFDGYLSTGNASSVVSGRVAYALGLQGPAVTIDTACSSSLVALHLAATALRQGECELALVGGVTVMSTPRLFVEFSRLKGMAADGRCKSFSARADGAGWSEGAGVLVLKPLSAAERDGDRVLAVVRGSAVNQDGRSQGLTAPNGPSQQRVVQAALEASRLSPDDIDAIEAHGTGTPLGDPIEAGALAEVFGPGRAGDRPVYLGSSKSNIGHAQAAAGVIGVMKMVLALQHETLPRTLYAEEPSAHVEWEGSGLELLAEARPWVREGTRVRRAGVSSFGLSGTNAHLVLEEAPAAEPAAAETADGPVVPGGVFPVVVSGQTEEALRAQAGRWADWLAEHPDVPLADVAVTAARHRTHFESRASVVAANADDMVGALRALAEGRVPAGATEGTVVETDLAMLFTGQGSQRIGMGRQLYAAFPVFRQAFDEICAALDPHLSRPLADILFAAADSPDAVLIHETEFTQ
ncbi:type I polyketide synthase, partial [Streptomyces monashensis]|uniref:type I polyketide synthase n=1 Tax=Streptomyces monashensis TaxID=1678012 RepID=UPI000AAFEEA9